MFGDQLTTSNLLGVMSHTLTSPCQDVPLREMRKGCGLVPQPPDGFPLQAYGFCPFLEKRKSYEVSGCRERILSAKGNLSGDFQSLPYYPVFPKPHIIIKFINVMSILKASLY